jgi:hypothetical protein
LFGHCSLRKGTDSDLYLYLPASPASLTRVDVSAWVAGTTYCVVWRWDCNNKLDGTNYGCVSIDDSHTFSSTTSTSAVAPSAIIYIGSHSTPDRSVNAIIEGLTVYRRVLFDGTYGTDVGNGDELALIYASGSGKKPEEVTGGDDIVFALPTNGTAEELVTGTGEAHSFPWASNELTSWHMQDDTAGAPDSWTAVNAPTLADAATADILYGVRSQKMSVDAADEGIKQAFSVTAGDDFYIAATVKTGGAAQGVDLRVHDATNVADIVELTTDSTDYTVLSSCFEVPAGCTSVEVFIESTDADTYDIHIAQVQVQANLVANGGMEGTYDDESAGGGGTVNVAPVWSALGVETDGTDTLDESADAHSGSKSQQINVNTGNEGIWTEANVFTANKWHLVSVWIKGTSGNVLLLDSGGSNDFLETITSPSASWTKYSFVTYQTANNRLVVYSGGGAANFLVDDVSVIPLDDVSLTVTPASEANSTEGTGLRVDGLDTLTQPITGLTATSGKIRFKWTPRHDIADANKFGISSPYLFDAYKDANNRIYIYRESATNIRFRFLVGGVTTTGSVNPSFVAGTEYLYEIEYSATQATLSVDGAVISTIAPVAGIDFGVSVPDTIYLGTHSNTLSQIDAIFTNP